MELGVVGAALSGHAILVWLPLALGLSPEISTKVNLEHWFCLQTTLQVVDLLDFDASRVARQDAQRNSEGASKGQHSAQNHAVRSTHIRCNALRVGEGVERSARAVVSDVV